MVVTDVAVFTGPDGPVRLEVTCPKCQLQMTVFVRGSVLDRDRVLDVLDHEIMITPAVNAPPDGFVLQCGARG